jgi:hypothetical protein
VGVGWLEIILYVNMLFAMGVVMVFYPVTHSSSYLTTPCIIIWIEINCFFFTYLLILLCSPSSKKNNARWGAPRRRSGCYLALRGRGGRGGERLVLV